MGVRNKYCSVCARTDKEHVCYKNWKNSSTSMESDILVEGFNASLASQGLKYKKVIGDGDSNVYFKLKRCVTYGHEIEKIECVNHCIKNYTSALYKVKQYYYFLMKSNEKFKNIIFYRFLQIQSCH